MNFFENFYFFTNRILAALISSIPLASAFGFSNGKHLLTELKKYGFEAERVADYGCYCQFLTDGGVNPPGMVYFLSMSDFRFYFRSLFRSHFKTDSEFLSDFRFYVRFQARGNELTLY